MSFNFKQGNIQRYNAYTHSSTTTLKLTTENSGSMIFCDCSANDITIDLPPVEDSVGLNYDFLVVGTLATNTINIRSRDNTDSAENKIQITGNFALGNTATLTIGGGALKGDRLQIVSTGSIWYLNNFVNNNTLSIA
jgi:hypothetical protein